MTDLALDGEGRLQALARNWARFQHEHLRHEQHSHPYSFDTCQHPDCVLVRSVPAAPPPDPATIEAENKIMRSDLLRLGAALGIPARPYSGHEAIERDYLPRIAQLQTSQSQEVDK